MRHTLVFPVLMMLAAAAPAADALDLSRDGIAIRVDTEPETVDIARDFIVTLTFTTPPGVQLAPPDLRDRLTGFRVAEDFTEDPVVSPNGETTLISRWRLVPEPVAEKYRLAPFVVSCTAASNAVAPAAFCTRAVYFTPPAPREPVTGAVEVDPKKDLPPLSWRLAGQLAGALAVLVLAGYALVRLVRKIREAIRVHRMSPIERAYYELDRLLEKGLPGRGFYKDFYVELTLVVRRYVARKYGIRAPQLTTSEFFAELAASASQTPEQTQSLRAFLESADLVKFAGVEATPAMADDATDSARRYLASDAARTVPPREEMR